jgi:hypothetical protein
MAGAVTPPNNYKPGAPLLQSENQGAKENEVKNCPVLIHLASASGKSRKKLSYS